MIVAVIAGTRPEAIKLAPVIMRLRREHSIQCHVINTGQHREMCAQSFLTFAITPDTTLETMLPGQSLGTLTSTLFAKLDDLLGTIKPDWVIVQGDTTSAMVAAMVAFYQKIKIGHVEAGLRTYDRWSPFPEEINRTFITHLADIHFAPTGLARRNLQRMSIADDRIAVTGNTVVDAIEFLRPLLGSRKLSDFLDRNAIEELNARQMILVTSHRRESFGAGLQNICTALVEITEKFENIVIVYPVHLNPRVQDTVHSMLGRAKRIVVLKPLNYLDFMTLVDRSHLVLTDSGGLQEEVPSFKKPILILRDVTERPEVVEVGAGRLVGTRKKVIVENICDILNNPKSYAKMAQAGNPFGDGHAAERIVARILGEPRAK